MSELNGHIEALVDVYLDMYRKSKHEIYADFVKYTIERMKDFGYDTYKAEIEYMYAQRDVRSVPIHYRVDKKDIV